MADYQLTLRTAKGALLGLLGSPIQMTISLVEGGVGVLDILLPPTFDNLLFGDDDLLLDNRIEVGRRVGTGPYKLLADAVWFTEYGEQLYGSQRLTRILASHANVLLKRKIVAYNSGSSQADKSALTADNVMKDIVDENLGAAATNGDRNLSTYLSIAADLTAGQLVSKAFARRNVLLVLQELAQASANLGTYVTFDIVSTGTTTLEFRTYTGQRGIDHRDPGGNPPLKVGPAYGNLTNAKIVFDHLGEITYVSAGGQGEGSARVVGAGSEPLRLNSGPFRLIEYFADSRTSSDATQLNDEANAVVRTLRPLIYVTGELQDTRGFNFGLDYEWGDYITAVVGKWVVDCRLSSMTISLQDGKETIRAALRGELQL